MRGLIVIAGILLSGGLLTLLPSSPTIRPAAADTTAGLQDQLINGLQARLPVDRIFIKKTVTYVQEKKLPKKTVMEVFVYVRKHITPSRRATVFRFILRKRAKEIGVTL